MKIDYEIIKNILLIFEGSQTPRLNTIEIFEKLNYNENKTEDFNIIYLYFNLLKDQELIECINDNKGNLGFEFTGRGEPIIQIKHFRLTVFGYQTLEAMNQNKVWEKIKGHLKILGVESLKQIPTLALKIITE